MDNSTVRLTVVDILQALHARILELEHKHASTRLSVTARGNGDFKYVPPINAGLIKFTKWFNDYWEYVFGVNIHFEILQDGLLSLSLTEPTMERNMFLKQFISAQPIIVDAFAGTGGELICDVYNFCPKKIYAIENSLNSGKQPELARTFRTLQKNVDNFLKVYPDVNRDSIVLIPDTFEHFLDDNIDNLTHVHYLHVDPPWSIDEGKTELKPVEMINFLSEHVFNVRRQWFSADVVCIKLRYEWKQCEAIMGLLPGYIHVEDHPAKPFKGVYHDHIFLKNHVKERWWKKSKAYHIAYKDSNAEKQWRNDPKNQVLLTDDVISMPYFPRGRASDYPESHYEKQVPPA